MTLVLILLFIFIIWPVIRVAWTVHKLRSQARKAYEQMYQQATGQSGRQASGQPRKAGWSRPEPPVKKIHREDGEFVSFEEITVSAYGKEPRETPRADIKPDQQIEDADWEEV